MYVNSALEYVLYAGVGKICTRKILFIKPPHKCDWCSFTPRCIATSAETTLSQIEKSSLLLAYEVNAVGPILVIKVFILMLMVLLSYLFITALGITGALRPRLNLSLQS
ncbi:hypothetical protein C5167_036735 [Papaver somniferum]|uniref:Uncharacterized protein n=1 Tax=Papaver somniferum TaxID=3469 RepID=A0A4Y7I8N6_PAPSO|nr:hypothetical protein C5167_036735 [Papaver somniferum]